MVKITKEKFAILDGNEILKYSLIAENNFRVDVLNFGGIISGVYAPDKYDKFDNVVLSYDEFTDCLENIGYFGAIVGRHAGRIANGKFSIDGHSFQLDCNRKGNNLHGGFHGIDKRIWYVEEINNGITLSYFSPHQEEKYPGNIQFSVSYRIITENTLSIEYSAVPDRKTLINLTNHTSFNLSGGIRPASSHRLQLNADAFGAVDETGLFSGDIIDVTATPFDFRKMKSIDTDLISHPQLQIVGGGFDHPFILNSNFAAKLVDLVSGRSLSVTTTEPSIVVYSGNFLTPGGKINGGNYAYKHLGICLETQNLPNAVNIDGISNKSLYTPEQPYISKTEWVFGIE